MSALAAKPILIVGLASFLTFERTELDGRRLTFVFGLAAIPMALIMLQPDVGTVLVFGAITLGMVAVAGARPRHFAILALIALSFPDRLVSSITGGLDTPRDSFPCISIGRL